MARSWLNIGALALLISLGGLVEPAQAAEIKVMEVTITESPPPAVPVVRPVRRGRIIPPPAAPTEERLVIRLDQPAKMMQFDLPNPPRLAFDLPTFRWGVAPESFSHYHGRLIKQVRYARNSASVSRIVLDLNMPVKVTRLSAPVSAEHVFRLEPLQQPSTAPAKTAPGGGLSSNVIFGTRHTASAEPFAPMPVLKPAPGDMTKTATAEPPRHIPIVAIDAGHGGQDPGCIGPSQTKEKSITLAYAHALKDALEATGRYHAILTRDKDYFIPLRQRVAIARQKKAELFISLHADSAPGAAARGLSLYSLSTTASDAEAAKLASRENKADIINGVDLSGASRDVTDILIELAQRNTMANSEIVGKNMLYGVKKANVSLLSQPHRHAGFAVLKAPDIPSVLVELGFLSHPEEERSLQTSEHRAQIIQGLVKGIDSYFAARTTNA